MTFYFFENNRYKRLALCDSKHKLQEYYEIYNNKKRQKGDIYVGIIKRIEPQLNAVFIDFDDERNGFLPITSIHPRYFNLSPKEMQIFLKDVSKHYSLKNSDIFSKMDLINRLTINQPVLVQIVRTDRDKKSVMLSTFLCLKGKYIKYIPNSLVQKIIICDNVSEEQIHMIQDKYDAIPGSLSVQNTSLISTKNIFMDIDKIINKWNSIQNTSPKKGELIYSENSTNNVLNELISKAKRIIYEGHDYKNFKQQFKQYNIETGFQIFKNLEPQVDEITSSIVQLGSGAYIILEQTSSGLTVDVNMGQLSKYNIEEAIFQTNKMAIDEIFRQIKLRHLGGMIIIDLITMKNNNYEIEQQVESKIAESSNKINHSGINCFGMLSLCCQYNAMHNSTYETCPCCNKGQVLTTDVLADHLLREINYLAIDAFNIKVEISEKLAEYIFNNMFDDIEKIKKDLNVKITFMVTSDINGDYNLIKA